MKKLLFMLGVLLAVFVTIAPATPTPTINVPTDTPVSTDTPIPTDTVVVLQETETPFATETDMPPTWTDNPDVPTDTPPPTFTATPQGHTREPRENAQLPLTGFGPPRVCGGILFIFGFLVFIRLFR